MPSPKHRTTSSYGGSGKSTTKPETSRRAKNSSPNAVASFEQVFGKAPEPELAEIDRRIEAQKNAVQALQAMNVPPTALAKTIHRAKLRRAEKLLESLAEHRQWLIQQ